MTKDVELDLLEQLFKQLKEIKQIIKKVSGGKSEMCLKCGLKFAEYELRDIAVKVDKLVQQRIEDPMGYQKYSDPHGSSKVIDHYGNCCTNTDSLSEINGQRELVLDSLLNFYHKTREFLRQKTKELADIQVYNESCYCRKNYKKKNCSGSPSAQYDKVSTTIEKKKVTQPVEVSQSSFEQNDVSKSFEGSEIPRSAHQYEMSKWIQKIEIPKSVQQIDIKKAVHQIEVPKYSQRIEVPKKEYKQKKSPKVGSNSYEKAEQSPCPMCVMEMKNYNKQEKRSSSENSVNVKDDIREKNDKKEKKEKSDRQEMREIREVKDIVEKKKILDFQSIAPELINIGKMLTLANENFKTLIKKLNEMEKK